MIEVLFIFLIVTTILSTVGTVLHTMAINRMIAAFAQQSYNLTTYNAMVAATTPGLERASTGNAETLEPVATGGSTPPPVHPEPHLHIFQPWGELEDTTPLFDKNRCCSLLTSSTFCSGCLHAPECPNLA